MRKNDTKHIFGFVTTHAFGNLTLYQVDSVNWNRMNLKVDFIQEGHTVRRLEAD